MKFIIDYFYNIAVSHSYLRGFQYERLGYKGPGNDCYPLLFLNDPILIGTTRTNEQNVLVADINIDLLDVPTDNKLEGEDKSIVSIQNKMSMIGLQILSKFKKDSRSSYIAYSMTTLRRYNDADAAGVRLSLGFHFKNTIDRCEEPWVNDTILNPPTLDDYGDDTTPYATIIYKTPSL